MKVVFDARIHLNYFSGISRYIICLLEAYLSEFPADEVIVLLNPTIQKNNAIYKMLEKFPQAKAEVIHTSHMGPKNYLVMGRIVKKFHPDVYHYPHLDAPIFTRKVPVVATIHDTNTNNKVKKFSDRYGLKSIYFKRSLALTMRYAKKVIFVSDSIKSEVLENYNRKADNGKFIRIYNGLETDFNVIDPAEVKGVLKEFNITTPYILYVGQIREHKNIDRLVAAFHIFKKKHLDFKLVLVGHNYNQKVLNDASILHIDKVTNRQLKGLYSGCKALLFPSLFEGFGFPILEAFSFGKPVVTSNYGAMAEIGNSMAVLVDPLSVESIANGLEQALADEIHAHDRINYTHRFTWKENAKLVRQAYLDAIEKGSAKK